MPMPDDEWLFRESPAPFWFLCIESAQVTIEPRPSYCDRGHWFAKVYGIDSIDFQDQFPRYFMDLKRAKDEMKDWLVWRLAREAGAYPPARP